LDAIISISTLDSCQYTEAYVGPKDILTNDTGQRLVTDNPFAIVNPSNGIGMFVTSGMFPDTDSASLS
jgi:hypothetical protein